MAKLIKETPTLTGKDAKRFMDNMVAVEKVPPKRRAEMQANYKRMAAIQADAVLESLEEAKQIHAGEKSEISFEKFLIEL